MMSVNQFLYTLYLYWEQNHAGQKITHLKVDEVQDHQKPHKAKITFLDSQGISGVVDLVHQQDCTWSEEGRARS